jgi:hypothetical protein
MKPASAHGESNVASLRKSLFGQLLISVLLAGACRSGQEPAKTTQRRAQDAAPDSADANGTSNQGKAMRLAAPLTAVKTSSVAAVAGRDRTTGQVVLAFSFDGVWGIERTVRISDSGPAVTDDIELFGSGDNVALSVRGLLGKGLVRNLHRVDLAVDAGLRVSSPVEAGEASCATNDGVFSLYREADNFKGRFWPFAGAETGADGLVGTATSEATLVCGQHRVFLAMTSDDTLRVLTWANGEKPRLPIIVPKVVGSSGEGETLMAPFEDQLVAVKLDEKANVRTLRWHGGPSPAVWSKTNLGGKGEAGLEAAVPTAGMLGLVLTRAVDPGKSCPDADALDTVAEVVIVDDAGGRVIHPPERIETWRCGAEPGPFFSGWAGGQLVVAWPRGADAACARAGVRYGGLSYAIVEPKASRAKTGHAGRAAEAIADAGCVDGKCYVAALTRGADPCGAADSADAGTLEMFVFP